MEAVVVSSRDEPVQVNRDFWVGRRVFLTGHTGFKGSWLALWLARLGASVHGFALAPPTSPSLFECARVEQRLASHRLGNICDFERLRSAVAEAAPEVVLHLAAQPLVRASYAAPIETYATNVLGTAHLLEAVRTSAPDTRAVVSVTTDKCYENREWLWGYREGEALGGRDPYSSSKACAELVTMAYRDSFLSAGGVGVGTARAGNVIGGGDWAPDRLIPDILRAHDRGAAVEVRFPAATRPWQHVLEPLSGYLMLAERLHAAAADYAGAWNFGPSDGDARSVAWILDRLQQRSPDLRWCVDGAPQVHEAGYLKLDSSKAKSLLGWHPRWNLDTALAKTLDWHLGWREGADVQRLCDAQIDDYEATGTG